MSTTRFLTLCFLLSVFVSRAQDYTGPGWFLAPVDAPAVGEPIEWVPEPDPPEGGVQLAGSVEGIAEASTPEIEALARGLEYDPERIFNYVHDNIRYVHYFGSKKGAQLTLLERSGNDFDQCALLVSLLRASGHTASYELGVARIPYEHASQPNYRHWVGASKPNTNWTEAYGFVNSVNWSRGYPFFGIFPASFDTNSVLFHRLWVKLPLGGTNYVLDPAFKMTEPVPGINLSTAMGLSTNDLMTAAGGTSTSSYIQNLDEGALRNKLRDYTTNLLSHLQNNYPNASVEEIIGGGRIVPRSGQPLSVSLPFTNYTGGGAYPNVLWDNIPTNLMTMLTIEVDGTNHVFAMPELAGQKLALTFGTNGLAQLWLEEPDQMVLEKQTSGGATVDVETSVVHPHRVWDFENGELTGAIRHDRSATIAYQRTNASYVLLYAFEADAEWLRQRQERLDAYRQQGFADSSPEVSTETLNIMSLSWLVQTERMDGLLGLHKDILTQKHHRFGRMGQESGKGYYIDVYLQLAGDRPASGIDDADFSRLFHAFDLGSYFGSAAEHGVIEQMQSGSLVAASTMKMLQLASAGSQKIFLANSGNWTSGANVRSQLTNYSLSFLDSYITNDFTLLLPQNGSIQIAGSGSWEGQGFVGKLITEGGGQSMQMAINGGYLGGFVSDPNAVPDPEAASANNPAKPQTTPENGIQTAAIR